MKKTRMCNQVVAATVTLLLLGTTGAWAQSECGEAPVPPSIPDDGATATEAEIEEASSAVEEFSIRFEEYNTCSVEEYNATVAKFERAFDAYLAKVEAEAQAAAEAEE